MNHIAPESPKSVQSRAKTEAIFVFLKGYAMGAANVIPGVSGGTVAFITGIFETLINSLKSLGPTAIRHLFAFRIKELWSHINGNFLLPLGIGLVLSVITLAGLLEFLFLKYPTPTWAFFFGLILASVYFMALTVQRWSAMVWFSLLIGGGIAASLAVFGRPAVENTDTLYLFICGVIAICSMIVPGLSGSFVLVLMGNYQLILGTVVDALSAIKNLKFSELAGPIAIVAPVAAGAIVGLLAFSHLVSWIFRVCRDGAIALMTGFVAGSLLIVWPWKTLGYLKDDQGSYILKEGERIVSHYEAWLLPDLSRLETWIAIILMLLGVVLVAGIEFAGRRHKKTETIEII